MIIIPRNYSRMKRARINWKKKKKSRCSEFRNSRKFFLDREETEISPIFEYARIGDTHVQQKQLCATAMMMCRDKCDFSFRVFNILSVMDSAFSTINTRALRLGAIELKICIGTTEMR